MNVKTFYLSLLIFVLFFNSCDNNPVEANQNNSLLQINGPTIIYSLIGENQIENRVYNSKSDKLLFDDNYIRANVRISPDKKNIVYVKNATLHPWFGYYSDGIPTVTVSNDMGKTEKELLHSDSSSAFFVDWISSEEIAISSVESGSPYLTIVNIDGDVLLRKKAANVYKMYMLPDGEHLVAYNSKEFAVLNVSSYDFQTYNPSGELSTWQTPLFTDSTFILSSYENNGYRLIEFNLSNNSFKKISIKTPYVRLIFADKTYWVYYNYVENKFELFRNGSQISSLVLDGYVCDAGLSLINENVLYFVGSAGNDESVLIKVDFNSGKVEKLTNHSQNNFIVDYVFYNL